MGGALVYGASAKDLLKYFEKIVFNLFSRPNEFKRDISRIYQRSKILKLIDLYKVKCCTTFFRILLENYATFLQESVSELIRDHPYNMRYHDHFLLPVPIVKSVKMNFLNQSIYVWNRLDQTIKDINSSCSFANRMTELFIDGY